MGPLGPLALYFHFLFVWTPFGSFGILGVCGPFGTFGTLGPFEPFGTFGALGTYYYVYISIYCSAPNPSQNLLWSRAPGPWAQRSAWNSAPVFGGPALRAVLGPKAQGPGPLKDLGWTWSGLGAEQYINT